MGQKVNPISLRMGISRFYDNSWYHSTHYPEMLHQALQFQSYIKTTCKSLLFSSSRYIIQNSPKKRDIFFFYTPLESKTFNNNFIKKPIENNNLSIYKNYIGPYGIANTVTYRTPRHLILLFLLILTKHSNNFINSQNIPQSIVQLSSNASKYLSKSEPKLVLESSNMFEKGLKESISIYPVKLLDSSMGAGFLADELAFFIERKKSFKFASNQLMRKIKKNPSIRGIKISCSGRINGVEMARTEYKKYGQTSLQTISTKIDYGTSEAKTAYGIIGIKVWVCYH